MTTDYGLFTQYLNVINRYEEKLRYKDNGLNTEDIVYIQTVLDQAKKKMLDAVDAMTAIDIFYSHIWYNDKLNRLIKKYNL